MIAASSVDDDQRLTLVKIRSATGLIGTDLRRCGCGGNLPAAVTEAVVSARRQFGFTDLNRLLIDDEIKRQRKCNDVLREDRDKLVGDFGFDVRTLMWIIELLYTKPVRTPQRGRFAIVSDGSRDGITALLEEPGDEQLV